MEEGSMYLLTNALVKKQKTYGTGITITTSTVVLRLDEDLADEVSQAFEEAVILPTSSQDPQHFKEALLKVSNLGPMTTNKGEDVNLDVRHVHNQTQVNINENIYQAIVV